MPAFKERDLTKGQLRKLTALRKSLGKEIADKAFAEWLASVPEGKPESVDKYTPPTASNNISSARKPDRIIQHW